MKISLPAIQEDHYILKTLINPTSLQRQINLIFFEEAKLSTLAYMLSHAIPTACSILSATAVQNLGLEMTLEEFSLALCSHLQVPIFRSVAFCPACFLKLLDTFSHKSTKCGNTHAKTWPKFALKVVCFRTSRSLNLAPFPESSLKVSQQRSRDIKLPLWLCGKFQASDVPVVRLFPTLSLPVKKMALQRHAWTRQLP